MLGVSYSLFLNAVLSYLSSEGSTTFLRQTILEILQFQFVADISKNMLTKAKIMTLQ
jgi:hypothetical protein